MGHDRDALIEGGRKLIIIPDNATIIEGTRTPFNLKSKVLTRSTTAGGSVAEGTWYNTMVYKDFVRMGTFIHRRSPN
eukprot:scaffold5075_cov174-Amphora_coffeaeformis.AAC.7